MENVQGYSTNKINKAHVQKLANDHIRWYLSILEQPMKEEFFHGYKHGYEDALKEKNVIKKDWLLIEEVLDILTEVGNGTTEDDLKEAKEKLFKFRDRNRT